MTTEHASAPVTPRPFFSSKRERRLWMWSLVVLLAIGATLGLARSLADLVSGNVNAGLFILCFVLVLATVVTRGLKTSPSGGEIVVALGVTIAYVLVFVRMTTPADRSHLMEYSVLALFIHEALVERARHRRVPVPALLAILVTSLLGTVDECVQLLIPSRVFDPVDILFNVLAAVMAVTASVTLCWARRLRSTVRFRSRAQARSTGARR